MSKTTATPALENDPDLDLRFGEEGILRPETTQQGDVRAILLHDGDSFSLAMTLEDGRYQYDRASADGRPIAGFAATVKQFAPDATFYPTRLLHQADKIIMLGTVKDNNNVSRPGITRFNASGTPDLVFGHVTPGAPPAEATTPVSNTSRPMAACKRTIKKSLSRSLIKLASITRASSSAS